MGFCPPVASFTPKTFETTELRSSLVYEVRVFVKDPADELRLGMPATVRIPLTGGRSSVTVGGCSGERGSVELEHSFESDILSCEGLTKEFVQGPKKIKALDNVSLSVARGAVTGLIGPDGAGKTTLIRLATGLFVPEAGSIRVLGIDVAADPQAVQ